MSNTMMINVQVPGVARAIQQINALAAAARGLGIGGGSGSGASGGGSGGGSGNRGGGGAMQGPMARLIASNAALQKALASGNSAAIFDARVAATRASNAMQRAQSQLTGPSVGKALQQAILSTRFNIGGQGFGVSPLVGRTMSAAGIEGGAAVGATLAIAALALTVKVATEGVQLFAQTLAAAVESLHASSTARQLTGGTPGGMAGLQALGIPAEAIAGLAGGLRNNLAAGGIAAAEGHRQGLGVVLPRGLQQIDELALLQKAIESVAFSSSNAADRLSAAQRLGIEALIPSIELYRRHAATIKADAAVRGQVVNKEAMKDADDLTFAIGRLKGMFDLLKISFSAPFLKDLTAAIMTFGDILRGSTGEVQTFGKAIDGMLQGLGRVILAFVKWEEAAGMQPKGAADWLQKQFDVNRKALDSSALDRHTAAMNAHAAALEAGLHGGGDRARNAVPAGWQGWYLNRAMVGNAIRLGAAALF